jgi:hypothetical protein
VAESFQTDYKRSYRIINRLQILPPKKNRFVLWWSETSKRSCGLGACMHMNVKNYFFVKIVRRWARNSGEGNMHGLYL